MRASNGFDRMSTPEELHQVLAVLDEFAPRAWMLPGEDQASAQAATLWGDTPSEESADDESLAKLMGNQAELKN